MIDLKRGELIECAFKLSATFAVPDVLYERELREYGGDAKLTTLFLFPVSPNVPMKAYSKPLPLRRLPAARGLIYGLCDLQSRLAAVL